MATIRKGYVDTSIGQIHFKSAGDGDPIVLLHQSPSSAAQWNPVLPVFADRGWRAIALDMPGFGMSDVPASKPDFAEYVRILTEAIRALGYDKVNLLGHHTGASMAMGIAAEHPELIRKLVLWGVPLLTEEWMGRLANEQPPTYTLEGNEILRMMEGRKRQSGSGYTVEMGVRFLIERLQLFDHSHWGHNAIGVIDHADLAKRMSVPTLVLCSDGDGIVHAASQQAAGLMPNGRYQDIPGASLDVPDEKPEEFVDAVDRFLREP